MTKYILVPTDYDYILHVAPHSYLYIIYRRLFRAEIE